MIYWSSLQIIAFWKHSSSICSTFSYYFLILYRLWSNKHGREERKGKDWKQKQNEKERIYENFYFFINWYFIFSWQFVNRLVKVKNCEHWLLSSTNCNILYELSMPPSCWGHNLNNIILSSLDINNHLQAKLTYLYAS